MWLISSTSINTLPPYPVAEQPENDVDPSPILTSPLSDPTLMYNPPPFTLLVHDVNVDDVSVNCPELLVSTITAPPFILLVQDVNDISLMVSEDDDDVMVALITLPPLPLPTRSLNVLLSFTISDPPVILINPTVELNSIVLTLTPISSSVPLLLTNSASDRLTLAFVESPNDTASTLTVFEPAFFTNVDVGIFTFNCDR